MDGLLAGVGDAVVAYRLRLKRRGLLWRAFRSRRQLRALADRTAAIGPATILGFATVRNEGLRLPYFLDHHRRLGIGHFLIVDNGSDDGSAEWLAGQGDVSVWHTAASYKASRFGLDWLNWLLFRHGAGHWCLTLDADEILIYPHWQTRDLADLTGWLQAQGVDFFAAMMLDLYPQGRLSDTRYAAGDDPLRALPWFDATGYDRTPQQRFRNTSIRGGVRRRVFFAGQPDHAPHLHKTPLIRWNRSFAYVSSTHIVLPRRLNGGFARSQLPTGALLHTKFLQNILDKSREEKARGEHFTHVERYGVYYDSLIADPDLWTPASQRFVGWEQLERLGLMQRGAWG